MDRSEAERWLGIAAKLLTARDFLGSRTFAIRARESDPNNHVSEQILAIVDTILSGEKRVDPIQQPDWYSILQLPRMVRDCELINIHYRRLVVLLNPENNRFPFADFALQLVVDAWSVLSDPNKKWLFDNELALCAQRGGSGSGSGFDLGSAPLLNTFQFFQQPQHQHAATTWQQQEVVHPHAAAAAEHLPPQWQMRDPTPAKGRIPVPTPVHVPPPVVVQEPTPPTQQPHVSVSAAPAPAWGMPGVGNENHDCSNNINNGNVNNGGGVDVGNDEKVEGFWTSCPYCLYIFEYDIMYKDCTLKCQHCRRGFHGIQIPEPPMIGGKKDNEGSFSCWSFYPLAFSMDAWEKHNQVKKNGIPDWVPFSPMFVNPMENGDMNFQWFVNGGDASIGPRIVERKNKVRSPRVYIDDDVDFVDVSEPSDDDDSSDRDWRNLASSKTKKKRRRKKKSRGVKTRTSTRGMPQRNEKVDQGNENVVYGGGVSVGGENMEDEETHAVAGSVCGRKTMQNKNMGSNIMRKHTRRSKKDMGNLDLNVEFNNDVDEHASAMRAVDGEEDVIENIGFFEGLDEFLSTLPILNADGDEKAKPS